MLIHKAAYVILRWEWVRAWLRQYGNPCPTYGHKAQCFVHKTQPVTVVTVVSASFATSKCCLHRIVSAGAESFLHVSGMQGQSASCSPISVVATRPFVLFCWHPSWVLIVSCCVKRSGSAKSIHRSSWVARRPCHAWVVHPSLYLGSNREAKQMIGVESLQTEEVAPLWKAVEQKGNY